MIVADDAASLCTGSDIWFKVSDIRLYTDELIPGQSLAKKLAMSMKEKGVIVWPSVSIQNKPIKLQGTLNENVSSKYPLIEKSMIVFWNNGEKAYSDMDATVVS